MASAAKKPVGWHWEILPRRVRKALEFLAEQPWINESGWYLAGGTALALQVGHRQSFDLDFFTQQEEFDNASLLGHFLSNRNWKTEINKKNTVYGEFFGAKISFIAYPFFIPKQGFTQYGAVRILHSLDIAVMKIIAISQRGRKRDFFDLYWCARNLEPLENLIKKLKVQYPSVAHDYHHLLKSMVYFADAESDPEPEIYFAASWQEVKAFFKNEVPVITGKIIRLNR